MIEIKDIPPMLKDGWKSRLEVAVQESGKSKRAISLAAGLGAGYVHSILTEGKDPSINNLISVCDVIGVPVSRIIYGFEITAEAEEVLRLWASAPPTTQEGILQILRDRKLS